MDEKSFIVPDHGCLFYDWFAFRSDIVSEFHWIKEAIFNTIG